MDEKHGVYEVDYHWIDGYNNWQRSTVAVVADDGAHAMDVAQAMVYMPYGANGAEYLCPA